MERLSDGLLEAGVGFLDPPDVNMVFARVPDDAATQLEAAGLLFYRIGPGIIRLVTSWQTSDDDIDQAVERFAGAIGRKGTVPST
jgi:threonine aldolase